MSGRVTRARNVRVDVVIFLGFEYIFLYPSTIFHRLVQSEGLYTVSSHLVVIFSLSLLVVFSSQLRS